MVVKAWIIINKHLKGNCSYIFASSKFYIIVSNNSLIIKKENGGPETTIDFQSFIPNIPFYYHLFDEDKAYSKDIADLVKKLRIRNAAIVFPDDSIELEVDKKVLVEFFMQCGVKKVQWNFQCFLLNIESKKYISLSKTTRTIVIQYIANNKSISKKYYDKCYSDIKQITFYMRNLHTDCQYENIPVYINNLSNDMESFKSIGNLVSLNDIIANIMKDK